LHLPVLAFKVLNETQGVADRLGDGVSLRRDEGLKLFLVALPPSPVVLKTSFLNRMHLLGIDCIRPTNISTTIFTVLLYAIEKRIIRLLSLLVALHSLTSVALLLLLVV
jgi:hypothetical protein